VRRRHTLIFVPSPSSSTESSIEALAPPPAAQAQAERLSLRLKWGLAGTAVAGCAYVAILDPTTSTIMPPCPFRTLTGLDCPGCGMTRGLHSLLNGEVVRAIDHNILLMALIVVSLAWFATRRIRERMGHDLKPLRINAPLAIGLGIAVGAFWLLRNLPFEPFHWFNSASS